MSQWRTLPRISIHRRHWLVTLVILAVVVFFLRGFMQFIEGRTDTFALNDVVLNSIPAINLSTSIFSILYGAVVIGLIYLYRQPILLLKGLKMYILVLILRSLCIYLVPLSPPNNMLILTDPIIDNLIGQRGSPITKDLFFSGHTSIMFLLFLVCENKFLKTFFLLTTTAIALMVLIQHVHYTIDVLAAPVFTWIAYRAFL